MKFKEYFPIFEMLDTKFSTLVWKHEGTKLVGFGEIEKFKIKIDFDPITYAGHDGINISFALLEGSEYTEKFQDKNTVEASKIIGAVTNAIKLQLDKLDWSFIVVVSKDNVEARHRLYVRIADRVRKELLLNQTDFSKGSDKVLILSKLTSSELEEIKKSFA